VGGSFVPRSPIELWVTIVAVGGYALTHLILICLVRPANRKKGSMSTHGPYRTPFSATSILTIWFSGSGSPLFLFFFSLDLYFVLILKSTFLILYFL
jgi:hypothetical protein